MAPVLLPRKSNVGRKGMFARQSKPQVSAGGLERAIAKPSNSNGL